MRHKEGLTGSSWQSALESATSDIEYELVDPQQLAKMYKLKGRIIKASARFKSAADPLTNTYWRLGDFQLSTDVGEMRVVHLDKSERDNLICQYLIFPDEETMLIDEKRPSRFAADKTEEVVCALKILGA